MTHDAKVQQWYEARRSYLDSLYIEDEKLNQGKEPPAGETTHEFMSKKMDLWMDKVGEWIKENPFPEQ